MCDCEPETWKPSVLWLATQEFEAVRVAPLRDAYPWPLLSVASHPTTLRCAPTPLALNPWPALLLEVQLVAVMAPLSLALSPSPVQLATVQLEAFARLLLPSTSRPGPQAEDRMVLWERVALPPS
jgi:hypothetical protein